MRRRAGNAKARAQAKWRSKQVAGGIVQVNVRVPARHRERLKEFAEKLREAPGKSSAAFKAAFPGGYEAIVKAAKRSGKAAAAKPAKKGAGSPRA
jgi:hypothetical protein